MSKSKKILFTAVVALLLMIVASPFLHKAYRRFTAAAQVEQINACLDSGGCMNPETMTCGPYTPNDPNVMCIQQKPKN